MAFFATRKHEFSHEGRERPCFVDFDPLGMLDNFFYSGHYRLPRRHARMATIKSADCPQ